MEILSSVHTRRVHTIKLTREMIVGMVQRKIKGTMVPVDAKVSFRVPTGGDYSGEKCFIEGDDVVWVEWETDSYEDTRA
jgi:hypothetical protein